MDARAHSTDRGGRESRASMNGHASAYCTGYITAACGQWGGVINNIAKYEPVMHLKYNFATECNFFVNDIKIRVRTLTSNKKSPNMTYIAQL